MTTPEALLYTPSFFHGETGGLQGGLGGQADGGIRAAQGRAAVEAALAASVGQGQHGEGQGQAAGKIIALGHTQSLADVVPWGKSRTRF